MKLTRLALLATTAAVALTAAARPADARPYRVYHSGWRPAPRYHHHSHTGMGVVFLPQGVYLGAGVVATHVVDQRGGGEPIGDGAGVNLFTGIRIADTVALELGWLGSLHDGRTVRGAFGDETSYLALGGVTADARVYVGDHDSALRPYLQGGVGAYAIDRDGTDTSAVGTGLQLGGGFDVHLGSVVDLGARVLYRGIALDEPTAGSDEQFLSVVTAEASLSVKF
jgi:hypothetical protein